jgi:hypothetical protein
VLVHVPDVTARYSSNPAKCKDFNQIELLGAKVWNQPVDSVWNCPDKSSESGRGDSSSESSVQNIASHTAPMKMYHAQASSPREPQPSRKALDAARNKLWSNAPRRYQCQLQSGSSDAEGVLNSCWTHKYHRRITIFRRILTWINLNQAHKHNRTAVKTLFEKCYPLV